MEVNASGTYPALYTKFSQIFQSAFLGTEVLWPQFASVFNSTTEIEQHVWLDKIPKLRQWQGDRIIRSAVTRSQTLKNVPFELTEELDEYKVRDNKIDAFQPLVAMMATQAKKWPDQLFFDPVFGAIVKGATVLGYDGVPFWSAAHPINPDNPALYGTQSNLVNAAFNATSYFNLRSGFQGFRGADGFPLYTVPNRLMTGTTLEASARQVLNTTYIAPLVSLGIGSPGAMQENPLKGTADYVLAPDMNPLSTVPIAGFSGTPWMIYDGAKPLKPFLFQMRDAPEFVFNVKPDSPGVLARHAYQYFVRCRGAGGYGIYWFAALGIG